LPKSLFPRVVTENPNNIIPLPTKINNARGNRPYTNKIEGGYLVYTCKSCPYPGFCQGAAVMSEKGMVPPNQFKGAIARSVLKGVDKFPAFAEKIQNEVLDLDIAIEWDRRFPMTTEEHDYRSNSS
jgi:endonuclease I